MPRFWTIKLVAFDFTFFLVQTLVALDSLGLAKPIPGLGRRFRPESRLQRPFGRAQTGTDIGHRRLTFRGLAHHQDHLRPPPELRSVEGRNMTGQRPGP